MMRRLVLGIALTAFLVPSLVAKASAAQTAAYTTVETVPPTPNLQIVYRGTIYRTDSHGAVLLPLRLIGRPSVLPTTFSDGRRAVFQRWYGRNGHLRAALDIYYPVQLRYVDLQGRPIDPNTVHSIQIRSSIGERFHPTARNLWLRGTRVVPLNGGLESKPIYYTIERVVVGGSNVVNESQQKFFPSRERSVTVQLLFYRARFSSRDAFFGFAVGRRIRLTFPQGTTREYPLGPDGTVVLRSLPRGNYHIEVEGGGISLGGPVALSRDQDVKVDVVSYLDLALAATVLALIAVGLPLLTRPHRRRQFLGWIGVGAALTRNALSRALPGQILRLPGVETTAPRPARLDRRGAVMAAASPPVGYADDEQASNPLPVSGKQLVASAEHRRADDAAAIAVAASAPNGAVTLSTATLAQLEALPGIGPATAFNIVAYRQAHGGFHSVDELGAIRGIGPTRLARLRDLVAP